MVIGFSIICTSLSFDDLIIALFGEYVNTFLDVERGISPTYYEVTEVKVFIEVTRNFYSLSLESFIDFVYELSIVEVSHNL